MGLPRPATRKIVSMSLSTCLSRGKSSHHSNFIIQRLISVRKFVVPFLFTLTPSQIFFQFSRFYLARFTPDDITINSVVDSYISRNNVEQAIAVFRCLKSAQTTPDGSVLPMSTYNIFLKSFAKSHKVDQAVEIYQDMKSVYKTVRGPDLIAFSMLIKALCENCNVETALEVVQDMYTSELNVDDIITCHLLEGCRKISNTQLGIDIFDRYVVSGKIHPSEYSLVNMLKLLGRGNLHDQAFQLVRTWHEKYGQQPGVIHYTCLMSGCVRSRQIDKAWAAYRLMISNEVKPDAHTLSTICMGLLTTRKWDWILHVINDAKKQTPPVKMDPKLFETIIQRASAAGALSVIRAVEHLSCASGDSLVCLQPSTDIGSWSSSHGQKSSYSGASQRRTRQFPVKNVSGAMRGHVSHVRTGNGGAR